MFCSRILVCFCSFNYVLAILCVVRYFSFPSALFSKSAVRGGMKVLEKENPSRHRDPPSVCDVRKLPHGSGYIFTLTKLFKLNFFFLYLLFFASHRFFALYADEEWMRGRVSERKKNQKVFLSSYVLSEFNFLIKAELRKDWQCGGRRKRLNQSLRRRKTTISLQLAKKRKRWKTLTNYSIFLFRQNLF